MTQFEYLSVLVSILIALGISNSVASWGHLLRARGRVRFYWLHGFWTLFIVVLLIQFWWGFWNFRLVEDWSVFKLLIMAAQVLALALAAFILAPENPGPEGLDLKAYYYEHGRLFFIFAAVALVMTTITDFAIGGQPFLHPENLFRLPGVALASLAAWSKNEKLHAGIAALAVVLYLGFLGANIQR